MQAWRNNVKDNTDLYKLLLLTRLMMDGGGLTVAGGEDQ